MNVVEVTRFKIKVKTKKKFNLKRNNLTFVVSYKLIQIIQSNKNKY